LYVAGIDIGGTFTDCAIVDESGEITVAKVPSTPDDFSVGFFAALEAGAEAVGTSLDGLLSETDLIAHGTTVATNVMAQRRGSKVGLLTTAGHGDALTIMRAYGRIAGLSADALMHYSTAVKPAPIISFEHIRELDERIDCKGQTIVAMDDDDARRQIAELLDEEVESIAVCLLWSFMNPAHEQRLRELVAEADPTMFVTTSHELVPRMGEYERAMAVAVNSYVAPASRQYLQTISAQAKEKAYERPILLMECSGGVTPIDRAAEAPVRLIGSGPAGGIVGARYLSEQMKVENVITTDMGGTTFDVALIVDGEPARTATTIVDQCEYYVPTLDMRSIGAGGGSIAWFDDATKTIKVGPDSAGAEPGPVAYGKGGTAPTVTDADLLLGYLNPDYFLDGRIALDRDAAEGAFAELGSQVGVSAMRAAAGVTQIVDFHMADLIRKMTVEKGFDPTDFSVFAYGGGGPLHGSVYARELGAKKLIVPLGHTASVWSALGVASSDILFVYEQSGTLYAPWNPDDMQSAFDSLEQEALAEMSESGISPGDVRLQRFADVRYQLQVHNVEVPIPSGKLTPEAMAETEVEFERRYEQIFGRGTGYGAAGMESSTLRLRAWGRTVDPKLASTAPANERRAEAELRKPSREVWWHEYDGLRETNIYDGTRLEQSHVIEGPAVIELPETTVLVRPGQVAHLDSFKNILIDL
jgi:N-methylhydantoinase A